ncbi:MAG: type II secretion system F family protein [Actinomycetota bacterium]
MIGAARPQRWQVERLARIAHALARELRMGATLHAAVDAVAGDHDLAGDGFRLMARRVAAGSPVVEELDRWAAALSHPDASMIRAVLAAGASSGAALADVLDRTGERLSDRVSVRAEARALSAQARASALVLTIAPLGFLALMILFDRRVATVFSDPLGRVCLAVGAALDLLGWLWMRHLVRRVPA